jgi:hypothetical protein
VGKDFKEESLQGKKRGGPTRSTVIREASAEGFASSGYKKVYADYSRITEEVLSEKRVPANARRMVKRYFQMIRPR